MGGYAIAFGHCFGCQKPFGFNPMRVPSISIKGIREPICQACVDKANPGRIAGGLPPIVPHPDAYEPCREEELE